jgi:hypothetical protein
VLRTQETCACACQETSFRGCPHDTISLVDYKTYGTVDCAVLSTLQTSMLNKHTA